MQNAADDEAEIDKRLQILRYTRWVSLHVGRSSDCAAIRGMARLECDQCKEVAHCLLCKTRVPGNQSGAHGCFICDLKGGTTFEPCPT